MSKTLIVIDMQNDFIDGSLGTKEAQAIVLNVAKKIKEYKDRGDKIIFTRDTHDTNYLNTPEGKKLPVEHCIYGTHGWKIADGLEVENCYKFMAKNPQACLWDESPFSYFLFTLIRHIRV